MVEKTRSLGGINIFKYEDEEAIENQSPPLNTNSQEEIIDHVEKYLGEVSSIFAQISYDIVKVDILIIPATVDYPYLRLVTSGVSDVAMNIPKELEQYDIPRYIELMVTLPGDWKIDSESMNDDKWFWPFRILRMFGVMPHIYNTFVDLGHSISNGHENQHFNEHTELCGVVLLPPVVETSEEFYSLKVNKDKSIKFLSLVPLYESEMNYKLEVGDEFYSFLDSNNFNEIINPTRKNLVEVK